VSPGARHASCLLGRFRLRITTRVYVPTKPSSRTSEAVRRKRSGHHTARVRRTRRLARGAADCCFTRGAVTAGCYEARARSVMQEVGRVWSNVSSRSSSRPRISLLPTRSWPRRTWSARAPPSPRRAGVCERLDLVRTGRDPTPATSAARELNRRQPGPTACVFDGARHDDEAGAADVHTSQPATGYGQRSSVPSALRRCAVSPSTTTCAADVPRASPAR
jgi:hypothetical protein